MRYIVIRMSFQTISSINHAGTEMFHKRFGRNYERASSKRFDEKQEL